MGRGSSTGSARVTQRAEVHPFCPLALENRSTPVPGYLVGITNTGGGGFGPVSAYANRVLR